MRGQNIDRIEEVRDWFLRVYSEKMAGGNAKVMLFEGHPSNPQKYHAMFVLGGKDSGYEGAPEQAWDDFFEEWSDYIREYPKKFTLSIGHPNGGGQKKMRVNVSTNPQDAMGGGIGIAGMQNSFANMAGLAKLQFDLYKTQYELEMERNRQDDSRVGRLMDNIIDAISDPAVINGLIGAFMGVAKNLQPQPTSVASRGFAAPEQTAASEQEVTFRSRFADYGDAIKVALFNNEDLVFQVMENLVQIIQDPEKVNKLVAYVNELNAVNQTKEHE